MTKDAKKAWDAYCQEHVGRLRPLLEDLGFTLEVNQPHLGGERYLMRAVTTTAGKKLILLGAERKTGRRVIIKASADRAGARELMHERVCRRVLAELGFAYTAFAFPDEMFFGTRKGYTISIQAFIEQDSSFLARPIEEQFSIALDSFKAQEGAHATTYRHLRKIKHTFGLRTGAEYLKRFNSFADDLRKIDGPSEQLLADAAAFLGGGAQTIEQYGDFLTHTDFVPHNFRVRGGTLYFLDLSSCLFGNKYEVWARFVNFMELHNPPLARALTDYVRNNRTPEESLSLKLMRVYRLGEIMWYYANTLDQSAGDLQTLNRARITWWAHVLKSVLADEEPDSHTRAAYTELRDRLRSPEEKVRQQDLH